MIQSKQELIFWYKPDSVFFKRLPQDISQELISEYNSISGKSYSVQNSCTYFEVCKSNLQLENFKLYPNPANTSATIEFDLLEETKGDITIVNIMGAKLKTMVSNSKFQSGHNTYQMDLSGIGPGIYLISINTDKGFKTQRLIVSQ